MSILLSRAAELRGGRGVRNGSIVEARAKRAGIEGGGSPVLEQEERPWRRRSGDGRAREAVSHYFAELRDPRSARGGRHQLLEILMIALCTILSGGQTLVDMALFGEAMRKGVSPMICPMTGRQWT